MAGASRMDVQQISPGFGLIWTKITIILGQSIKMAFDIITLEGEIYLEEILHLENTEVAVRYGMLLPIYEANYSRSCRVR